MRCPQPALARIRRRLYLGAMEMVFDLDDRARLRERFYGASHTVLARL
ncbi:isopropylmalate isomerase [Mesobacterium sp. TK19101]|uniref:Isopropylmalate isomerase n=1 Tax=Mesobacterium hydrothermale TaxID=3111907 RepID=A0ABU6HG72_9RHOB|nr:isopropylmalate isomerase [Mesobacterium sp. TK19101]MEC3860739.1 isopropylmalate isomerase [Mesobacterium sp. TK19101]